MAARAWGWKVLVPFVLFVALSGARWAWAQSPDDLNRAAGALFEKGDFAAAARLLELVLQQEPSAKAHRNLALCYAKLEDHEERAVLHMQAYLRARPDAQDRASAEKMIADLDLKIARKGSLVFVESDPGEAFVFLDDAPLPLGKTLLRARLPLGSHVLRFDKKGYETVRRPVEIVLRQELRVAVVLTPAHRDGFIIVRADAENAQVTIDGRPASLGRNVVTPGAHQVRVSKATFKTWDAEIRVDPGGTTEVVARLPRLETERRETSRPLRGWRWVSLGLAGAATATGIIAYARALMDRSRAEGLNGQSFESQEQFQAAQARELRSASRNTDLARWGLGAALAFGATTVVFFILDARHSRQETPPRPPPRIGLAPMPGGGVATLWAEF